MSDTKRTMPVKKQTVTMSGDYEGWTATVRINPPAFVFDKMMAGTLTEIRDALTKIALSWDFVDENGDALPQPSAESIGLLPVDLILELVRAATTAIANPEKNS